MFRIIKETPKINFLKHRKVFFILSFLLAALSISLLLIKNLNYGIDFKGGILIEVDIGKDINITSLRNDIKLLNIGDYSIQQLDNSSSKYLIKIELSGSEDNSKQKIVRVIKDKLDDKYGNIDYRRVEYVGPTVSKELILAGLTAIVLAILSMLVYIWFRFELPFAIGAVIALVHDIVLTVGMFSISSLEFNLSTVAAILLIIGYSMNDTVVVYDRIRENIKKFRKNDIFNLLNKSINETLSRTVNTTATTILALLALFIFGGNIIKDFSFAMIWGIVIGTYSSILIATPILLNFKFNQNKKNEE
tara:strand:- start:21 stop:935 length:915 start_codon:yes stop_codon:yes gene_type:complete